MAALVGDVLTGLGASVRYQEVAPGRANVLGVLPGTGPTVLLSAHLDTVPDPEPTIPIHRTDGFLHGRGSCDCKGGMGAMLTAMGRLAGRDQRPTVLFVGTVDEEAGMTGSGAVLSQLPELRGAVLAEPTDLVPVRANNGCVRVALEVRGTSCHSSTSHLGVNAISAAARVVADVDRLAQDVGRRVHELTGTAQLTVVAIDGGVAHNVVPDRCEIVLDRRLIPGEDVDGVLAELDALVAARVAAGDEVERTQLLVGLGSASTPADAWVVDAAVDAVQSVTGAATAPGGVAFATDGCNIQAIGGVDTVVLGPGSIALAHTKHELVPEHECEQAVEIYEQIALSALS
jgi:acetylornithine deacetylase/succinyl-diaminopimelate desuccinylase-like protein